MGCFPGCRTLRRVALFLALAHAPALARGEEPPAPAPAREGTLITLHMGFGAGATRQLGTGETYLLDIEGGLRVGRRWRLGVLGAYGFRPDHRSWNVGLAAGRAFRVAEGMRLELLAEGGVEKEKPEDVDDSVAGTRQATGGEIMLRYLGVRVHFEVPSTSVGLAVYLRSTLGSETAQAEIEQCFAGSCTTTTETIRFGGPALGVVLVFPVDLATIARPPSPSPGKGEPGADAPPAG